MLNHAVIPNALYDEISVISSIPINIATAGTTSKEQLRDNLNFRNSVLYIAEQSIVNDVNIQTWFMVHAGLKDTIWMYPNVVNELIVRDSKYNRNTHMDAKSFGILISLMAYVLLMQASRKKGLFDSSSVYMKNGLQLKGLFESTTRKFIDGDKRAEVSYEEVVAIKKVRQTIYNFTRDSYNSIRKNR